MTDTETRQNRPHADAILDIRRLLLTPNPEPRYPRAAEDEALRIRNRKRLRRAQLRALG